jgi:DNA-binding NarL/FixJ family response regulator
MTVLHRVQVAYSSFEMAQLSTNAGVQSRTSCRILLAHDLEIVRLGIRELLRPFSDLIVCGEAADGWEAIQKSDQLKPDVVMVRLSIPRANGLIVSCRIRRCHPEQKVLILGMIESKPIARDLLRAGVRGFISDNDSGAEIVSAVEAVRCSHTYFDRAISDILIEDYLHPSWPRGVEVDNNLLSHREHEVLQLLAEGRTTKEVATTLGIGVLTAGTHRNTIMRKLRLHNVAQLVRYAVSQNIIGVPVLQLCEIGNSSECSTRASARSMETAAGSSLM